MRLEGRYLPSDRGVILVAFSGGPDSTALLHLLHAGGYYAHAAHVHHGLRGEEADGDAAYCAEFCQARDIPFTLIRVDVSGEQESGGGGVQEVARRVRYEALERCASEVGASVIATAHNRDDNAETILLNILRGAGPDGLRGIPERRGRIVRPLLGVSRAEIEAYCAEHELAPRRDSSNDSTKYSRNEVRHKLMPYLRERFNPRVEDALLRLSVVASEESDYLDTEARRWLGNRQQIDRQSLSKLPTAMQRRVLRLWLREARGLSDISFEFIEQIREATFTPGPIILPPVQRETSSSTPSELDAAAEIDVPGMVEMGGWRITGDGQLPAGLTTALIRFWRFGDRMRFPFGRRKLSDLFGEAKWPEWERYQTPLLVEPKSQEVLAIANWRVSPLAPDLRFTAVRIEPIAS